MRLLMERGCHPVPCGLLDVGSASRDLGYPLFPVPHGQGSPPHLQRLLTTWSDVPSYDKAKLSVFLDCVATVQQLPENMNS